MKKLYFFFSVMLATIATHAAVTVTPLTADYNNQTVTFRVAYSNAYNNQVWVWIDFCPVAGVTPSGSFAPATITFATIVSGSGTISGLNGRGFFVGGNATNSGTTVTATLNPVPAGQFNWCAYGSDYPPNVLANTNGSYTLVGTPPFTLIAADGTTKQTVGKTIAISVVTVTPSTITDITGYPGLWCPYTGSDLVMDATHRCTQRQSGAKNWEAWIKDARDNQIYRIAQLSTGLWTMDDYLNYNHSSAYTGTRCTYADLLRMEYVRYLLAATYASLCPTGWRLPSQSEFERTVEDWKLHLTNTFVPLLETVWDTSVNQWRCNPSTLMYTSYIVQDCYGYTYGQRVQSIDPVTYASNIRGCYNNQAGHRYTGYARCVRVL
jgi:uncharacterized protein (TIGR02145 family)